MDKKYEWIQQIITQPYKKYERMSFAATLMDLEIIILSKPEKESQISEDIIYMWNQI